jgi:hypothetical protein
MHEVRVESLEKLESREDRMLFSANAGSLSIVFSQEVWENLLANAPSSAEPTPEELEELDYLNEQLEWHADEESFGSAPRDVPCGYSGLRYDLVLRPAGLFVMTTGYHFAPVVDVGLAARIGAGLEGNDAVEQAYVVAGIADDAALLSGDESLRVLSACGAARAVPAVARCRRSCGRCSRGGLAGETCIPLQPGDNLCRS